MAGREAGGGLCIGWEGRRRWVVPWLGGKVAFLPAGTTLPIATPMLMRAGTPVNIIPESRSQCGSRKKIVIKERQRAKVAMNMVSFLPILRFIFTCPTDIRVRELPV